MTSTTSDTLRKIADLLDPHPDLPRPYVAAYSHGPATVAWNLNLDAGEGHQKEQAAAIIKALGGKWDKHFDWGESDRADFTQTRDGIDLRVTVQRSAVCERVVVAEKVVTIPAVEAQSERTETVDVVEWRCSPLLSEASA